MAFYIRSFDREAADLDEDEFLKLTTGLMNNAPDAVPRLPPRARIGADLLICGISEAGRTLTIPLAAKEHMELFALKVLYALYFKLTGRFAGPGNRYLINWAQAGTEVANLMLSAADEWFDQHAAGRRSNVDRGDQFTYQSGYNEAHGFFGVRISFAGAFVLFGVIGPAREMAKLKRRQPLCPSVYAAGLSLSRRAGRSLRNDADRNGLGLRSRRRAQSSICIAGCMPLFLLNSGLRSNGCSAPRNSVSPTNGSNPPHARLPS